MCVWCFTERNAARASSLCWASVFLKVRKSVWISVLCDSHYCWNSLPSRPIRSFCLLMYLTQLSLVLTLLNAQWSVADMLEMDVRFTPMKSHLFCLHRLWRVCWRPLRATMHRPFRACGVHLLSRLPLRPRAPQKAREALLSGWDLSNWPGLVTPITKPNLAKSFIQLQ